MPNRLRVLLGAAPALICACFLPSAVAAGDVQLSLHQYTQIAQSQLSIEVLPRLFYNGLDQVDSSKIGIVETGAFPAIRQDAGSGLQISSVAIAIMDRVAEADYKASSTGDIGSLDNYLRTIATLIFSFAKSGASPNWTRLVDQLPNLPSRQATPDEAYIFFRRPTLTNLIGSVLVRELAAIDIAQKYPDLSGSETNDANRRAAASVVEAKFEAAPPTALVVYSLLKKASDPKIIQQPNVDAAQELQKSLCDESNFQSLLRPQNPDIAQSKGPFNAGRRIVLRYASCR